ncbi:hypothetical protein [Iodidimonas nitroreducens]|nr:hypothetical protein [Iodidimonas nitroreducens]
MIRNRHQIRRLQAAAFQPFLLALIMALIGLWQSGAASAADNATR